MDVWPELIGASNRGESTRMDAMKPRLLTALAVCMALTACSGGPSNSRMASQIAEQFNQEFGINFVQVNDLGVSKGHKDGDKRYVADVHYILTFTRSLAEVRDKAGPVQAMELMVLYGDFHAGDTKHISNRVVFDKTGKGWVLTDSRREE
jgi:hypothetical protein